MLYIKRVVILLIILTVSLFLWMDQQQKRMNLGSVATIPQPGYTAPNFQLNKISYPMETITLSDLTLTEKNGVILYFWTSWCPFCSASMEALQHSFQTYGDEIHFVGINVTKQDSISEATKFLEKHQIHFENVMDIEGTVSGSYYVPPIPATIFINSEGIITHRKVGAITVIEIEQSIAQMKRGN
ncbi:TlpA family protein disulfide reductase [Evansella sp. AB-rgal1]|uniref:TlpA family protein disulfide reductase n=1 Tax=Evansella sp. AB-rgal1 TaxID=3242696 RepID=UPI00359CBB9A